MLNIDNQIVFAYLFDSLLTADLHITWSTL